MKSKRTLQLHGSIFMVISCFMMTWQASAQTFSNARTGTGYDGYVINNNNSNYWTFLRLQTSNKAWNISNQDGLNWRYSANNNHGDQGDTKMKLTIGGDLGLGLGYNTIPSSRFHIRQEDNDAGGGIKIENSGQGRQFNLFVDGSNNSRLDSGGSGQGPLVINLGGGNVGIGTTAPSTTLHVAGTGHFSGNVGIGTSNPSTMLDVAGIAHFSDDVGIGTTTPRGKLDVDGPGDIYLVDDPNSSSGQNLYIPGHVYLTPHAADISYIQARRQNNSGSTHMRFRTSDDGQLTEAMHIDPEGHVGIGTTSPAEKLEVNGAVKATSFVSSTNSFPDYVFAADYKITPLSELEAYVKTNRHLPNMPSEKEVVEQGLNVSDVVVKSVENIETIYLHLIRMEKEIKALQQENAALKQQLKKGR